jgi:hypothetical protein
VKDLRQHVRVPAGHQRVEEIGRHHLAAIGHTSLGQHLARSSNHLRSMGEDASNMGHYSQQLSEKSSGAAPDIDNGLKSVEGACGKNSTGALNRPAAIAWSKSA